MFRIILLICVVPATYISQNKCKLEGRVEATAPLPEQVHVRLPDTPFKIFCDSSHHFVFENVPEGNYRLEVVAEGFFPWVQKIKIPNQQNITIRLIQKFVSLSDIVVTGTMKETHKDDSPINIDVITPKLFQKTATPNLFEATSLVNGVKPQINCNVCNTGDIHINGMEGPYTLILIDGAPIVSGLSSVYGLMGIPAGMIERLEIAKGPAGALYGSEAMGGTINLITKNPFSAPKFYADYYVSSYLENNLDLSAKVRLGNHAYLLSGLNTFYYDKIFDLNHDNFTDVTLQKRISTFNKISFIRKNGREFSIAARYVYEDRWGGEKQWRKEFRGGDSVYGESIYTNRFELISKYQWPLKENIFTQLSYNIHDQDSYYGKTAFMAFQSTAFTQTYWNKNLSDRWNILAGISYKHLWFDDNTVVTQSADGKNNLPQSNHTAGIFLQNENSLDANGKHRLLLGYRADYNDVYRFISSPRVAYKWSPNYKFILRVNFGSGFRIVNVFTEDHAALTGARNVVFVDKIKPESSYNSSLNLIYKMKLDDRKMLIWEASGFYYHFTNKIYANYDLDPNLVVFDNLHGYAFSRGGSLNLSTASSGNLKLTLGATYADVQNVNQDASGKLVSAWQLQTPHWSGNIIAGYFFPKQLLKVDVTGNWYGPQRLPVLPNDYRPAYSPWFCLLNLQVSKTYKKTEFYTGIKNLLNFLPKDPIMRPYDPFDKKANDPVNNPNAFTFDPSYNYAPVQGIRTYIGLRVGI